MSIAFEEAARTARRDAWRSKGLPVDTPVNYVQGEPVSGRGVAGVILRAVAPETEAVRTIAADGEPRGRVWRTGESLHIVLQDMRGVDAAAPDNAPASQARRAIERADRILRENGAAYRDVARTWFYLSEILSWYSEFNAARSAKYAEFGLMPRTGDERRLLPASTGIRATLSGRAACSLDLVAVAGAPGGRPTARFLANPGQLEAVRYGSAFSRCAVIEGPGEDLIEISGTAAIDEAGVSLCPGDIRGQVRCTMDKVRVLIGQARADLGDICAATVFVKRAGDADAVREVLADMGLENFPAVYVVADVCREELLFEIDAEAVVPHA